MQREKLVLIFLLFSLSSMGQANIDSLFSIWNNANQQDTNRLKAIKEIIWKKYLFTQSDSAFYFSQLQYDFAKSINNKLWMASALNTQGISCSIRGDYSKAINYYTKCLKINKELGDKKGIASSLNNIGIVYKNTGNYSKAIDYYTQCLKIWRETSNKRGMANSLNNIGVIYKIQGDYSKAIDYYAKSLRIEEKLGDEKEIASSLYGIAVVYKIQGNYVRAIEYSLKSLNLFKEARDKQGEANTFNNIGLIYTKQANFYSENQESKSIIKEKRIQAIEYFKKSLKLKKELGDKKGIASAHVNLGNVYFDQHNYNQSIYHSQKALYLALALNVVVEVREAEQSLYKSYKAKGNLKKALEMYELYIANRDSILSEKNKKEIIRQEYKYAYEKQAATDSIKQAEAKKVTDAQIAAQKAQLTQEKTKRITLYGGIALLLLFGTFMYNRFRITKKQKNIIEAQKKEVEIQKELVEEKNKEITASIQYAKRIQTAILATDEEVKKYLPKSFIFYKPKDIVAGDFYWMESASSLKGGIKVGENHPSSSPQGENIVLFAAADCTGHGVPGAMLSVVCNNALNRSVKEYGLTDPGEILNKTRNLVTQEFRTVKHNKVAFSTIIRDGMDIALCSLRFEVQSLKAENPILQYAGAHNPLWIIRSCYFEPVELLSSNLSTLRQPLDKLRITKDDKSILYEVKANKQPIGKFDNPLPYTTHTIQLYKGDTIYIFSDGFVDQFGGTDNSPGGKKFKAKAFRQLLLSIQDKTMKEQHQLIEQAFENWKGNYNQVDDICIIGVRI